MNSTLIALWLAISSAFNSGAAHLEKQEYAQAIEQFNTVILASSEFNKQKPAARLLRGHAYYALGREREGLADLLSVRFTDQTLQQEAERMLDAYGATPRQRLQALDVAAMLVAACDQRDQAKALSYCQGTARAALLALWDDANFRRTCDTLNRLKLDGPQYRLGFGYYSGSNMLGTTDRNQSVSLQTGRLTACVTLGGRGGHMLFLAFDDGWWVTDLVAGPDLKGSHYADPIIQADAILDYTQAHNGVLPPSFDPEHLPNLSPGFFTSTIPTRYDADGKDLQPQPEEPPMLYHLPPAALPVEARAHWLLLTDDPARMEDNLLAVIYADGRISMLPRAALMQRLDAQAKEAQAVGDAAAATEQLPPLPASAPVPALP